MWSLIYTPFDLQDPFLQLSIILGKVPLHVVGNCIQFFKPLLLSLHLNLHFISLRTFLYFACHHFHLTLYFSV